MPALPEGISFAISMPASVAGATLCGTLPSARVATWRSWRLYPPYAKSPSTKAVMTIRAPAARLLTRTERGGRGFRSRPLGASIPVSALAPDAFRLTVGVSGFGFTGDLHFACFLSAAENEFGLVEEPINDVHVVLDAIVDHLLFAVRSDHDQNRSLPILRGLADLDVRLLPVVKTRTGRILSSPFSR